ncbi:MAG: hypothetical protein HY517_00185 [Candidatus Aenigmarchaeota archaeon]|nr:hypothetical protein [Candidatus Aenigmarchaeota archaeon]
MKIVIKIGGSISIRENGPDFSYFSGLLPILKKIKSGNQLIVAIGGGKLTRAYGKSIEKFQLSSKEREEIFIQLIGANVRFLAALLGTKPLFSLEEITQKTSGVIGGIAPGRSTDANGAMAAKRISADLFIKMTDVDGVFTADPKKRADAMKLDNLKFSDMKKLAVKGKPNSYGVLDKTAIETLSAANIRTIILNGKNPKNLMKALNGEKVGTIIEN